MREGWRQLPLGDLATWTSGGTPRKSETAYWGGDIPWISGASMTSARLSNSERRLTPLGLDNGSRLAKEGSTLILVRGMSLHEEVRIGQAMRDVAFNQDVKALAPGCDIDGWFLTYALIARYDELLNMVHAAGHGTGVLATDRLKAFRIGVPPLSEQRRIVELLTGLDDLIDAERRNAQLMDALVQSLGRQFLASLDGEQLAPLSELGEITKGYSYKSAELHEGGGWLVNLKNVGRDGSFQARGFKPLTARTKPTQAVDTGDVLVAQTDLTQDRAVIGRPVRVRRGLVEGTLTASLDLVIVRPAPGMTREYLFAVLNSPEFRAHALGYCNGTTVVHMGSGAIPNFVAPIPPPEMLERFTRRIGALRNAADAAVQEAERLAKVREELLPLLFSGSVLPGKVAA